MPLSDRLQTLLKTPEPAPLGPGPREGVESSNAIESRLKPLLDASGLPEERRILIRALLLLWHDHLEASHALSQQVGSRDGSYVHGLMHRREPDFGNARYWFRKVGHHPALPELAQRALKVLEVHGTTQLADRLVPGGHSWDPLAMVDLCESASRSGNDRSLQDMATALQCLEFEVLLNHLSR